MSDPSRSGFTCCGSPMTAVAWALVVQDDHTCGWLCENCGIWRHVFVPSETQLRALADTHMRRVVMHMFTIKPREDEREQARTTP